MTTVSIGDNTFYIASSSTTFVQDMGTSYTGADIGVQESASFFNNIIEINGSIKPMNRNYTAIETAGLNTTVHVTSTGSLDGKTGIYATGQNFTLVNDGSILAKENGLYVLGDNPNITNNGTLGADGSNPYAIVQYGATKSTINNTGTINGTVFANADTLTFTNAKNAVISGNLAFLDKAGQKTQFTNDGTVMAGWAIDNRDGDITVVNHGTMNGILSLGGGNDSFDNRGGIINSSIAGGAGDDTYILDAINQISEEAGGGKDTIQSEISMDLTNVTYSTQELEDVVLLGTGDLDATGNALKNALTGNAGNNKLDGKGGSDTMTGGNGNDTYYADLSTDKALETNADKATGGTDTVRFSGTTGTFKLGANIENLTLTGSKAINGTGNALDNIITGNKAANIINGGGGSDTMKGGDGDDTYYADRATDKVTETNADKAKGGVDLVHFTGTTGTFKLGANVENLTLDGSKAINGTGNDLANSITGNKAANIINGGGGVDTMTGGDGNDTYYADLATDKVTETNADKVKGGVDLVHFTGASGTFTLGANVENLKLDGTSAINGSGNGLANSLTGNSAVNTLKGGAGADRLDGGKAADILNGGDGNDTYYADMVTDKITETNADKAKGGTDLVHFTGTSGTFLLGANVENLTLDGTKAINGTGNGLANTLIGNSAANTLKGAAGADRLVGGKGTDILTGGADADMFVFKTGYGKDTVTDFKNGTDHFDLKSWDAITDFSDLKAHHLTVSGNDLIISAGTDKLILHDTLKTELDASDFLF